MEAVTEALFGESGATDDSLREINEAIRDAFEFFGRRAAGGIAIPEWVPTPENLQFVAEVKKLDKLVYAIIARRREEVAAAEVYPSSLYLAARWTR